MKYELQCRAQKIANRIKMPYTWERIAELILRKSGKWPERRRRK